MEHSLVKALRAVPAFASLDEAGLVSIVGMSANLFWSAGSRVFDQGSTADGLYVVLAGNVRIFDDGDPGSDVAHVGPGDFFGELSLVLDTSRTKSAEATLDSEILVVPTESFRELLASSPDLAAQVRQKLSDRLPDRAHATQP